jgi:hypothetical protein
MGGWGEAAPQLWRERVRGGWRRLRRFVSGRGYFGWNSHTLTLHSQRLPLSVSTCHAGPVWGGCFFDSRVELSSSTSYSLKID